MEGDRVFCSDRSTDREIGSVVGGVTYGDDCV